MHGFNLAFAATLLIAPAIGQAQDNAKIGQKQKAWLVSNFRGFTCASGAGPIAAVTVEGPVSFDSSGYGGVDLAVTAGGGGLPTITAHAINTKGTGTSGRMASQSCPPSNALAGGAATCSLSGNGLAPAARFTVPLAMLGDPAAKSYIGTVTIVKRASSEPMIGQYLSKKGYDYYQMRRDMRSAKTANPRLLIIASCDTTNLTAKGGKPSAAGYDLAVAKK